MSVVITSVGRRKYGAVSANSFDTDIYTVPTGKTLTIRKIGGNAAFDHEVKVEIKNDSDVIFSTHHDDSQATGIVCAAGSDVIIRLVNDSSIQETIGGWWEGILVE